MEGLHILNVQNSFKLSRLNKAHGKKIEVKIHLTQLFYANLIFFTVLYVLFNFSETLDKK